MRLLALLLLSTISAFAQETLTLNHCYHLARQNYPTLEKLDWLSKTEAYTLANANRAYLPSSPSSRKPPTSQK